MEFLSTTVKGLEDIASKEIASLGGKVLKQEEGKVYFSGPEELIYVLNYASKTVFRTVILIGEGTVHSLEDIRKFVETLDISFSGEFEVRTKRKGTHSFTSMDVNAVVGEMLLKKCPNTKVNLSAPEIRVLCWLEDDKFVMGFDTTGESLHRRGYRVYQHPAPLNPVLAALLIRWSGWRGETLVDPFCGSGTVLIEAHHSYNRVPNKFRNFIFHNLPFYSKNEWTAIKNKYDSREKKVKLSLVGIEKFQKHIEGAQKNLHKAGVDAHLYKGLAEKMHLYVSHADYIITNPPFGLRIGSKKKIFRLYENFAEELENHFSGTQFVLITPYTKFEHYFDVLEKREIMYGDLPVKAYRFKI